MSGDNNSLPTADSLFDDAVCGLLFTAKDGAIKRVNLTFCRWTGYSREELLDRQIQTLMSVEARTFHRQHWLPLMRIQGSITDVKFDFTSRDGHLISLLLNAIKCEHSTDIFYEMVPFKPQDHPRYERKMVYARMLAEHLLAKNRRTQLEDFNEEQQNSPTAKDRVLSAEELLGIVSHDLRNPLAAIKMATNLLQRHESSERQLQILGHIVHAINRAERLVGDLLDFTLTQEGRRIAISEGPIDLHQLVTECLDELRMAFPGCKLNHERIGHGELMGDSDRIYQMVGNLVTNAITYGDAEGIVTVSSRFEHQKAVLAVHNVGTPLSPELVEDLFDPMVRGTHENTGLRSVGLGLFIVREVVKAHQGEVEVTSSIEGGTTFTATFPRTVSP